MVMPTIVNGRPVRLGAWTAEEDRLLADWQKEYGNRWSAVSKKIPGRTGQQCAQRWRHKVNPNIRKEKWTEHEDRLLASLYKKYGCSWAEISRNLEGRTDQQCMGRWRRHLDPAIKREAWKAKEDVELRELHAQYGSQWATIAKFLPGRTAQQCRARWHQMDVDWVDMPSQSSSSICRSAFKPRKPRVKRHSAYSESDDEEISDCDQEGYEQEEEDDYHPYQPHIKDFRTERLGSGSSCRQNGDGDVSQASEYTTGATHQSGRRHWGWNLEDAEHQIRDPPTNFYSSAPDEELEGEEPPNADTESPPFVSTDQNVPASETKLLNRMAYARRSPSCRVVSPDSTFVAGPYAEQPSITPPKRAVSRAAGGTPSKQHSPGASEQTAWESSPIDNVLRLIRSPDARGKANFLSPHQPGVTTPDWSRKTWTTPPSTARTTTTKTKSRTAMEEDAPAETPTKRGPVPRRLDVESALRPAASERLRHKAVSAIRSDSMDDDYGPNFLSCPAKKLRSSIQKSQVRLTSTAKKASHACDALQQLSMVASLMEKFE